VHRDAFLLDPAGYIQALFWRARGLKVRSRNRLAALMGRSPRAYNLWIARVEPKVHAELLRAPAVVDAEILAVIDASAGRGSLENTSASLDAASHTSRDVVTVRDPFELDPLISPDGTWLCIVRPGDRVASDAFEIYSKAIADADGTWLVYADDDLITGGARHAPHFKSGWNPELFENHDFVTGSAVVRVTPEMLIDLDRETWAEQLTKRAIAHGPEPVHVAAVLHHREHRPQATAPAKPVPALPNRAPAVTVIIPTRNQLAYLRKSVEGVQQTAYPKIELVIVDNGSDEPQTLEYLASLKEAGHQVLCMTGAFNFSALNNAAVQQASGDMLCFLNNDIEVVEPDWLALLVRQATRDSIGAVGGRLLYPDGTLQHAGVVTGVGGGAAHAHRNLKDGEVGYFLRDRLPQRVSAVTAACLVVSKTKFLAVGGFNEVDFPVAFNDVDLCLKLNARGWQSFYEPRAVLIHHESKSRGSDSALENRARFAGELAALKRHWGTDAQRDPFHHPHLSPFTEQFHIAV
jgi:GT2 family glycosyltransferase